MSTTLDLINLEDAALRLEISKTTILRAIKAGELEAIKLGHSYKFTDNALKNWLRSRTINAPVQEEQSA